MKRRAQAWVAGVAPAKLHDLKARAARQRKRRRLETGVSRDPQTGQVRRGRIERRAFGVTLHLPKRLEHGNDSDRVHWSRRYRMKAAWSELIQLAAYDSSAAGVRLARQTTPAGAMGWIPPPGRALVVFTRLVPNEQHFVRDVDNLWWGGKALADCLVQAGFLRDDSMEVIDRRFAQAVSRDGLDWTVVAITVPEEGAPS